MSIQPVLGPYQFATAEEELNCGCGGDYCTPFINSDRIAFQVASAYSCCESVAGCPELTAECVTAQSFGSALTVVQATYNLSYAAQAFSPDDYILFGNANFAANTKYIICFTLREHTTTTTIKALIGSVESALEVTGNGDFCLTVDPAFGAPTAEDWGIIVTGGDTEFAAVLESMTLCVYREFSAALYDDEGNSVASLSRTEGESGNQMFQLALSIPGEIAAGCYEVRLTEDCGDETYISQCLTFMASIPCAGKPEFKTLLFKWRNRNDAFGFDYTTDTNYYNYLRVYGRLKHPTFPDDTEIPVFSDNTNTVINSRVQKLWKVSLGDLPEYIHNSISTMRRHSDFQIDGDNFVVSDGSYSPNWRRSSELAPAEFEAFDQSFDGVSTNC